MSGSGIGIVEMHSPGHQESLSCVDDGGGLKAGPQGGEGETGHLLTVTPEILWAVFADAGEKIVVQLQSSTQACPPA